MLQSLNNNIGEQSLVGSLDGNGGESLSNSLRLGVSGSPEPSNNRSNSIDSLTVHQNFNNAFATKVFELV